MPSSRRSLVTRQPDVADVGCSCRRSKLSSLFSAPWSSSSSSSSSSSMKESILKAPIYSPSTPTSSTSLSDQESPSSRLGSSARRKEKSSPVEESVAVVMDSSDPYVDFRDSMLLMIVEKEIFALEDLHQLVRHLISLNSPSHHRVILRAFAEVWNTVFAPLAAVVAAAAAAEGKGECRSLRHETGQMS